MVSRAVGREILPFSLLYLVPPALSLQSICWDTALGGFLLLLSFAFFHFSTLNSETFFDLQKKKVRKIAQRIPENLSPSFSTH